LNDGQDVIHQSSNKINSNIQIYGKILLKKGCVKLVETKENILKELLLYLKVNMMSFPEQNGQVKPGNVVLLDTVVQKAVTGTAEMLNLLLAICGQLVSVSTLCSRDGRFSEVHGFVVEHCRGELMMEVELL
jgi:dihydroxyacid dehydratase/phosphogluconate dehydratase